MLQFINPDGQYSSALSLLSLRDFHCLELPILQVS